MASSWGTATLSARAIANAAIEAGKAKVFFNRGAACQAGVDLGTKIDAYTCIIYTDDALSPSTAKAKAYFAKYAKYAKIALDSKSAQSALLLRLH